MVFFGCISYTLSPIFCLISITRFSIFGWPLIASEKFCKFSKSISINIILHVLTLYVVWLIYHGHNVIDGKGNWSEYAVCIVSEISFWLSKSIELTIRHFQITSSQFLNPKSRCTYIITLYAKKRDNPTIIAFLRKPLKVYAIW